MFKRLYNQVLSWAEHQYASRYLFALSVAESSFFPIPPDVMLAPMCLAKPNNSLRLALVTTVGSVIGGIIGYFIGYFSFDIIEPLIETVGYSEKFLVVQEWFEDWGFWAVLIAGFSPIPYKVFTITAGLLGMSFLPFVMASIIGRGARFFLVAYLVSLGGDKLRLGLNDYIERIGWLVTAMIVVGIAVYKLELF
ncbi:MAG: hypothetical protein COB89_00740 [Piscirickettsiaceae bacterium]|nr:MAG: hypothetical protein COB89_00740 [Piscirickettsiaceae bacterium]